MRQTTARGTPGYSTGKLEMILEIGTEWILFVSDCFEGPAFHFCYAVKHEGSKAEEYVVSISRAAFLLHSFQ